LVAILVGVACSDDPVSEDPPPEPTEVDLLVEGTVTDTTGAVLGEAAVSVYRPEGGDALDRDSTSADGSYALSLTVQTPGAPDSLRLTADANGYEPGEARVPLDVEEETSVRLERDLRLTPREAGPTEATAAGTVTDEESGDPIEGAAVTGTRPGRETLFETTTGASGAYEATFTVGDAPGEVTVAATAGGYESSETTVPFADEMTADLALTAATTTASASGTITNAETGDAITDATVTGTRAGSREVLFKTSTDANGDYGASFDVADPPDEVTIAAEADGFEREATTVSFSDEMTADLALAPATTEATVTGTVTEGGTGDPIQGATVTGTRPGRETLFETTTGTSGAYEATFTVGDAPGEVTVAATAGGYESSETTVPFADEMTADLALTAATTTASASGTITNAETGDAITDATVTGTRAGSREVLFKTSTDANGDYGASFDVADPPDEVTIAAEADGFEREATTVSFSDEMTADLALAPATTEATVTGTVTEGGTGDPIQGATVTGTRAGSGETLFSASTDANGDYEATYDVADPPGEVAVTAGAEGFKEATETVSYDENLAVDLALSPQTYEQVVTGTVTDDLGEVVEDGDAVVTASDGDTVCDVTTQAFMDGDCVDTGTVGNEPESYTVDVGRVHLQDQEVTVPFVEAENADVELSREFYQITGSVVNEGSQSISGQEVKVSLQDSVLTTASTGANGNHSSEVTFYDVTDVENPEGDVVYPESEFYKQASVGFTAQDPDQTVDVGETTLEDKLIDASVEGNVSSSSGSALEGAEVSADGNVVSGSDVTNAQGDYAIDFSSVPVREAPSSIDMSASLSGFEDETDTISFESSMVKDFTLQEIVNNYTVDITVENKEDGSPLNDVNVGSSELNTSKMTGSDGNVEFSYQEDSSLNNLTFTFEKTDFVNSDTTVAANTNHDFTKALSPEAPDMYEQVVKGSVTTDQGNTVDGGDVLVTSNSGETICDVTTQAFIDGDCVDTGEVGSEPDSYTIDIDRVHLEDQEVTVPFEDAENADVELPREFYEIIGSVVNEDSNPVSEQDVNVTFNDQTLTATTTDANGNHSSEVTFYEVTDVENPEGDVVYPESEFYKQASVGFTAQDPDQTLDVGETTLLDKLINATFQGNIFDNKTNEGISNVSVEYQTDQGHSKTATTDNMGDFSGQLDFAKRNEPATVDLIVNEGEEQGYESKTVQENFVKDLTRDVGLESLVQESINFTLDPYDVRGNAINDLTVSVKSPSGDVQSFPVENGEINVLYEVENVQEALKIWHDFGNNKYNDVLMIREQNQGVPPIAEDNIANNNMIEGWSHGEPFDTLSVAASQLDGKQNLDAYLAEYSHDTNVGQVNVNDSDAVELAFDRIGNIVFGYDEVDNIDKLRVLLFEYNLDDPSVDIDSTIIAEEENYLHQILGNLTQHPKVFDYEIDRISDPSELDPYEQDNFENTLRVWHEYTTAPTNGTGAEGSENRYSTPNVSLPSGGVKKGTFIEEIVEASAGMQDPQGGDTKGYTLENQDNPELNSFGETVYNLNLLLNKGTEIE
jgi:hypothetical protein